MDADLIDEREARRQRGLNVLRHVIGDEHFERRRDTTNEFNQEMRRLSEDYCFAEIWTRPGLPLKTRSLLCLAMLAALNRANELRIHVGGALNNGCTPDEIKEVFLQALIYAGLPAGVEGLRIAEEVLRERGIELGEATATRAPPRTGEAASS